MSEAAAQKPVDEEIDESQENEDEDEPEAKHTWGVPVLLFVLTFISTLYVGAGMAEVDVKSPMDLLAGWTFAVPLMAILLAHELGHYFAGRIHKVDISPPLFLPMPLFLLGTLGAVIRMRGRIKTRNALLDVGASGPLAGLVIALPVLIYGMATSPIEPLPAENYLIEGRSMLYLALLAILKGPIPEGYDIFLSPTAFAGWAGLLVTMINLIPVGQLDGGHVAYALVGKQQDKYSRTFRFVLPVIGIGVGLYFFVMGMQAGETGEKLYMELLAGMHWIVWAIVLTVLARFTGANHPPTGPEPLSPGRKTVAIATLVIFVLLFMPSWLRQK